MRNFKKIVLLLVIGILALTACTNAPEPVSDGGQSDEAQSDEGQAEETVGDYIKVNIGLEADPATLAPWLGTGNQARTVVLLNVFESLFSQEEFGGDLVPVIASGYEQLDDYTYRISIREDVYDSLGNPIKASDVVFSYKTADEMGNMATFLIAYEDITLVDEYTVDIVLNSTEVGSFLNSVTWVDMVSQEQYESDPEAFITNPIGSGPYKVESFTPGSGAVLVKNDNFWQGETPNNKYGQQNCDEIEYKVIVEPTQVAIALETGEIDFASNILPSDVYLFEDSEEFQLISIYDKRSEVLLYNNSESSPMQDVNLRKAVSHAIDSQAILDGAFDGKGDVVYTYGNPSYPDYLEKWSEQDYYGHDVAKAQEYLADSSYAGETLVIMTDPGAAHTREAEIIQAYLTEAGINSEIVSYEPTLFNTYRFDPTQWDIQLAAKGSGDFLANVWKYSFDARLFGGATQSFLADEELQSLLEVCLNVDTHTDEAMDNFHNYLKDTATGIGLLQTYMNYVAVSTMDEVVINHLNVVFPGASTYADDFAGRQ